MDQTAQNAVLREVFQMLARLAETRAAHEHGADPEFAVDEMIERDTGRRDVAASVGRGDLDPEAFPLGVEDAIEERLDGLYLDQGDFAPTIAGLFRVEPSPCEIPIAFEPASREGAHFGDRLHRRRRFRRDMDGDDGAFPHAMILACSTACYESQPPSMGTIATERMTGHPEVGPNPPWWNVNFLLADD